MKKTNLLLIVLSTLVFIKNSSAEQSPTDADVLYLNEIFQSNIEIWRKGSNIQKQLMLGENLLKVHKCAANDVKKYKEKLGRIYKLLNDKNKLDQILKNTDDDVIAFVKSRLIEKEYVSGTSDEQSKLGWKILKKHPYAIAKAAMHKASTKAYSLTPSGKVEKDVWGEQKQILENMVKSGSASASLFLSGIMSRDIRKLSDEQWNTYGKEDYKKSICETAKLGYEDAMMTCASYLMEEESLAGDQKLADVVSEAIPKGSITAHLIYFNSKRLFAVTASRGGKKYRSDLEYKITLPQKTRQEALCHLIAIGGVTEVLENTSLKLRMQMN